MSLITFNDILTFCEKAKQEGIITLVSRLLGTDNNRTSKAWQDDKKHISSWWQIPEVQNRWREKICGDENKSIVEYISQKYLSKKYFLSKKIKGLSLGCGLGAKELDWLKQNESLDLIAVDISADRIVAAKNNLPSAFADRIKFICEDVNNVEFDVGRFDFIITDSALHHFSPIENFIKKIADWLNDDGIFYVNEYMGPSRFQWMKLQVSYVNEALLKLPKKYKVKQNGKVKNRVYTPGYLTMYLSDPSEAAQSEKIREVLPKYFDELERKNYGGAILHLLFKDIAYNFVDCSNATRKLLQDLFLLEDELMDLKRIDSDFACMILQKKLVKKNSLIYISIIK
jgi:SAM-dependent methyltransferase